MCVYVYTQLLGFSANEDLSEHRGEWQPHYLKPVQDKLYYNGNRYSAVKFVSQLVRNTKIMW